MTTRTPPIPRYDPRKGKPAPKPAAPLIPRLGRTPGGKFNGYQLEAAYHDDDCYAPDSNYFKMDVNYRVKVIISALGEEAKGYLFTSIWPRKSYAIFSWRTISDMLMPVTDLIKAGVRDRVQLRDAALKKLVEIQAEDAYTKVDSLLGEEGAPMQKIADAAESMVGR